MKYDDSMIYEVIYDSICGEAHKATSIAVGDALRWSLNTGIYDAAAAAIRELVPDAIEEEAYEAVKEIIHA